MSADNTPGMDAPAVALLFESAEQSAHLREALVDLGARIVLEGPATDIDRAALDDSGADVLVVNLDAALEEHLDRIHDAVDVSRQRVVYNDADASRQLSGWDQARWARHLAAKVMDQFDTDPPRPRDARTVQVDAAVSRLVDTLPHAPDAEPAAGGADTPLDGPSPSPSGQTDAEGVDHEALATELGALMAEGSDLLAEFQAEDASDFAQSRRHDIDIDSIAEDVDIDVGDWQAMPDSDIADSAAGANHVQAEWNVDAAAAHDDETESHADPDDATQMQEPDPAAEPQADAAGALSLDDNDDVDSGANASETDAPRQAAGPASADPDVLDPEVPQSPDWETVEPDAEPVEVGADANDIPASPQAPEWELVGDDADVSGAHAVDDVHVAADGHDDDVRADPASFGIDKVSAAEYLAPTDVETDESPIEPGITLELVSLEESVAPSMIEAPAHELSMDVSTGLRRLVVIGATADCIDSTCDFLAGLTARPDVALVLIQHLQGDPAEALLPQLSAAADIPVRVAEHGAVARSGEVLVMPAGRQLHLDRSGLVRLDSQTGGDCDPCIDDALSVVAAQFGPDALAILLVTDANDAVAGAQAIHDCGGRVWLHHHASGTSSSLVSMLREEGLVDAEDAPAAFAVRLIEETGAL